MAIPPTTGLALNNSASTALGLNNNEANTKLTLEDPKEALKKAEADLRIQKICAIVFGVIVGLCVLGLVGVLAAWAIVPLASVTAIGLTISAGIIAGVAAIPFVAYLVKYKETKEHIQKLSSGQKLNESNPQVKLQKQ